VGLCKRALNRFAAIWSAVGMGLDKGQQQTYVHQMSKGCYPGVLAAPGGRRCYREPLAACELKQALLSSCGEWVGLNDGVIRRCNLPGWEGTDW
jgi:hypothetical protein